MEGVSARGRTQSWPVLQQDSSGQEMAERLYPSAFNRAERAMIKGAERRQRTFTGFPEASHVLSKLPFRTTPRCPVVLPRTLDVPLIPGTRTGSYSFHSERFRKSYGIFRNRYYRLTPSPSASFSSLR